MRLGIVESTDEGRRIAPDLYWSMHVQQQPGHYSMILILDPSVQVCAYGCQSIYFPMKVEYHSYELWMQ